MLSSLSSARCRKNCPALFALVLTGSALAQTAERPGVAVGDSWQFAVYYTVPTRKPNRTWVITSVDGGRLFGTENGELLTLTADLNIADSPRQAESNPKALSFPLQVGKRWRYTSNWLFKPKASRGTISVDVAVIGYEAAQVPAGTFLAFKLEASGELGGSSPSNTFYAGQTKSTYWYSPAARAIVKSVVHNPYQGTSTVELVDFKLRSKP